MIKTLKNPVFLLSVALASLNQFLEKILGIHIPVVHAYLDDLLCMPIVLTLGLAAYRAVIPNYRLNYNHMVFVLVLYSVFFEYYLPQITPKATADVLDVLMYALGLTVFGYFINNKDAVDLDLTNASKR